MNPSPRNRMTTLLVAALAAIATERGDVRAAVADHATLPIGDRDHVRYLSYASAEPGEPRADLVAGSRLMIASTSRQTVLERCLPQRVTDTCWRIDLRDLKWSRDAWRRLMARYPYHRYLPEHADPLTAEPLCVRADWLLVQLADANESPAYYELLLGEVPKTRDRWLELLAVEKGRPELHFGMVEEKSGVAKQRVRWLESFPALGGYAWGTRDSLAVDAANDPLEHPDGEFDHDGEEWIVGLPKVSTTTHQRGVLQVYLLAAGDGARVDKAPVDVVEDATRFRGTAEIRNPGSCVQCHGEGLKSPTQNGLRDLLTTGAELVARDYQTIERVEAFHLGELDRALSRANEDFGAMVELACGLSGPDAAAAFKRAVLAYDAPLSLEDVARELGVAPAACRNAIALESGYGRPLGARAAGLAHGRTIPREALEGAYHDFHRIQAQWGTP